MPRFAQCNKPVLRACWKDESVNIIARSYKAALCEDLMIVALYRVKMLYMICDAHCSIERHSAPMNPTAIYPS